MAKRKDGLGDSIAAAVRAQLAPLAGLGDQINDAVGTASSALGAIGPLVRAAVRDVADTDTIKALADPTRLAILRVLMPGQGAELPVMSAKELAEALEEPQTKLYRHLKVLESVGLIEVAETRIVSGIVETRYRAAQSGFQIDPKDTEETDGVVDVVSAMLVGYRDELRRMALADRIPLGDDAPEGYGKGVMMSSTYRVPVAKADEYRKRLIAILDEMNEEPSDPDGIQVNVLACWYTPLPDPKAASEGSSPGA